MARTRPQVVLEPILVDLMAAAVEVDDVASSVLDGAEALLRRHGLRGWSIDDVAEHAGLGRMTVYRRFATRDQLVQAVLARELRETMDAIDAAARRQKSLEDKVIEGGLVALAALRGSVVEELLHDDPATFLPFVTTGAGPLLAIARQVLVAGARGAGVVADEALLAEVAEAAARLSLSFILTRDTVLPVDDPAALRTSLRRIIGPMLASLTA
jgi:AcrR family transcriptional regulator